MYLRKFVTLSFVAAQIVAGCSGGDDKECIPNQDTICKDSVVYWIDSCGNIHDRAGQCDCGCNADFSGCLLPCDCIPVCDGKECGPNGCGGLCPPGCLELEECNDTGQCEPCDPNCTNKECGPDGCGGICGYCTKPSEYCNEEGICVDDCFGRECGYSPRLGYECGRCSGETDYCTQEGQCENDCEGRECGVSPHVGHNCGTCTGTTEYCSDNGICVDDCAGRECGLSPIEYYDCGTCGGETEYCSIAGECLDDCEGLECGYSPNAGYNCGTCTGDTFYCNPLGKCVDDCEDRVCGLSPVAGYDCGSCPGQTDFCTTNGQCLDDCQGRFCGPSPHESFDCGSCMGSTEYCTTMGQCKDDCANRECGPSPVEGFDCGQCPDPPVYCTEEGHCEDDCSGRECGLSPNIGYDCGSCENVNEYCTENGKCRFAWVQTGGGSLGDNFFDVDSLIDGSSFVTGSFKEISVFGQGQINETYLDSAGYSDIVVARYMHDGSLGWAVSAGGSGTDGGYSVSSSPSGECVVCGRFSETAVFGSGESGETLLVSSGDYDAFVARYDINGELVWAEKAGGSGYDLAATVGLLDDGSLVVAGQFTGDAIFCEGCSNETVVSSKGGYDVFIAKYDVTGELVWVKTAGGPDGELSEDLKVLNDGSVLVAGRFETEAVFGEHENNETVLESLGGSDVFIAKYQPDGTLDWAKAECRGAGAASAKIDNFSDGSFIMTGVFNRSVVFGDGEQNEVHLSSESSSEDIYIAKFYQDGSLAWAKGDGGQDNQNAYAISLFDEGGFLVVGGFEVTAVFGVGGVNQTSFVSRGERDGFVAKYDVDGELVWARQIGGTMWDVVWGVSAVTDGTGIVSGQYENVVDFPIGNGHIVNQTAIGEQDCYLLRTLP